MSVIIYSPCLVPLQFADEHVQTAKLAGAVTALLVGDDLHVEHLVQNLALD